MIKRTDEEIKKLIDTLQAEVDDLPEHNIFGDSNAEGKSESENWIKDLKIALTFKVLPDNKWNDVRLWLLKEYSALNDYFA